MRFDVGKDEPMNYRREGSFQTTQFIRSLKGGTRLVMVSVHLCSGQCFILSRQKLEALSGLLFEKIHCVDSTGRLYGFCGNKETRACLRI